MKHTWNKSIHLHKIYILHYFFKKKSLEYKGWFNKKWSPLLFSEFLIFHMNAETDFIFVWDIYGNFFWSTCIKLVSVQNKRKQIGIYYICLYCLFNFWSRTLFCFKKTVFECNFFVGLSRHFLLIFVES